MRFLAENIRHMCKLQWCHHISDANGICFMYKPQYILCWNGIAYCLMYVYQVGFDKTLMRSAVLRLFIILGCIHVHFSSVGSGDLDGWCTVVYNVSYIQFVCYVLEVTLQLSNQISHLFSYTVLKFRNFCVIFIFPHMCVNNFLLIFTDLLQISGLLFMILIKFVQIWKELQMMIIWCRAALTDMHDLLLYEVCFHSHGVWNCTFSCMYLPEVAEVTDHFY